MTFHSIDTYIRYKSEIFEKFKKFRYEIKKQTKKPLRFFDEIEEMYTLMEVSNPS